MKNCVHSYRYVYTQTESGFDLLGRGSAYSVQGPRSPRSLRLYMCQKDSIGCKNLFGLKNPAWTFLRSKLTPIWTRLNVKQVFQIMSEIGDNMMAYLKKQNIEEDGLKTLDAQELSYRFAVDLFAGVSLGVQLDSFNFPNVLSNYILPLYHSFRRRVTLVILFYVPYLANIIGSNIYVRPKMIESLFRNIAENREKTASEHTDFIDYLLQQKNEQQNPLYKFEGDHLFSQSGMFFPGFESSSTLTSFSLMELGKNGEYQERARKDIQRAITEHGWSYRAVNDMKYLDQCLAEAVRLHPAVSTLDRIARKEYQIPQTNVVVLKGMPVFVSLYGLLQDPRFFRDAERFQPERFQDGTRIPKAYIPFGIGPRTCWGMKMGQLHAKVVIARLLKEYKLSLDAPDKIYLNKQSILTVAGNGIMMNFQKLNA